MKLLAILLLLSFNCLANGNLIRLEDSGRGGHSVQALVGKYTIKMLLDTGSTYVVLPSHLKYNLDFIPGKNIVGVMADGRLLRTKTYVLPEMIISGCVLRNVEVILMPGVNILGLSAIKRMTPITLYLDRGVVKFYCN